MEKFSHTSNDTKVLAADHPEGTLNQFIPVLSSTSDARNTFFLGPIKETQIESLENSIKVTVALYFEDFCSNYNHNRLSQSHEYR